MNNDLSVILRMDDTFRIAAVLDADELRPDTQAIAGVQVLCHQLAAFAPARLTRSKADASR